MPRILVVDDSPPARRVAAHILGESGQHEVVVAASGADALATLRAEPIDLVVTDLVMPEMSGIELVEEVREELPHVPVIVFTSKGSEAVAVEALQAGAASYISKRHIGDELLGTVDRVLAVATARRKHEDLMDGMVSYESRFELANDRALFRPLVRHVQELMAHMRLCDQNERMRVGMAFEEALNNAVEHGNLEADASLRESDMRAYCAMVEERRTLAPYDRRRVHVAVRITRDEAEFVIRDEGRGFDWASLPVRVRPDFDAVGGRGVMLMRMFMDVVEFNEPGNEVRLVKRRRLLAPEPEIAENAR